MIAIASRWCSRVAIGARGARATCGSLGVPVPPIRRCVGWRSSRRDPTEGLSSGPRDLAATPPRALAGFRYATGGGRSGSSFWRFAGAASSLRMTPAFVAARVCRHASRPSVWPRSRDGSHGGSYIHRLADRVETRCSGCPASASGSAPGSRCVVGKTVLLPGPSTPMTFRVAIGL